MSHLKDLRHETLLTLQNFLQPDVKYDIDHHRDLAVEVVDVVKKARRNFFQYGSPQACVASIK